VQTWAAPVAAAGRTGAGAAPGGAAAKEDARLRETVLGEILDARPSTRWDDVAGLGAAKQARAGLLGPSAAAGGGAPTGLGAMAPRAPCLGLACGCRAAALC